ncbi:MAG: hypothetical protein IJY61_04955 [Candidatus Gastranaerophilales bacterium]|nr:hypothetical protein [Candidatus Gastranaerophilales bacterium]
MSKIDFIKTDDNSTGLYSNDVNDIFHSKLGAYTEALEKFYLPIKDLLKDKKELNILDICYGIGYNTKVLMNKTSASVINIDALEFDKEYILLSPFILDSVDDYNLKCFILKEIISKIEINDFDYKAILEQYKIGNEEFFDASMSFLNNLSLQSPYRNIVEAENNRFLHNIYYKYVSNSLTEVVNSSKYINSCINFHIGDARKNILNCNKTYDVVFLDAFSPQKDPTLWSVDFLKLVTDRMNNDSVLVSYSKSTPFRSALKELGLYIGKTILDNVDMGTIASFNRNNILNPLSEYDHNLLNTRSGITYKDPDLSLSGFEILKQREIEQKNSNLISHTQFLKNYSK